MPNLMDSLLGGGGIMGDGSGLDSGMRNSIFQTENPGVPIFNEELRRRCALGDQIACQQLQYAQQVSQFNQAFTGSGLRPASNSPVAPNFTGMNTGGRG